MPLGPTGMFCAIAFAAGVMQAPEPAREMRTKVLPGNGYIRYEVMPGDDEQPAGELIVVHTDKATLPKLETAPEPEPAVPLVAARREDPCKASRARLLARLYEMRGMVVDEPFAEWLEQNTQVGERGTPAIQIVGHESLLLTAVKTDGIARGLAEDLARCEQANSR